MGLCFPKELGGLIIGRNGSFAKLVNQQYGVFLKIIEPENTIFYINESISTMTGHIDDLKTCIKLLFDKIEEYDLKYNPKTINNRGSNYERQIKIILNEAAGEQIR